MNIDKNTINNIIDMETFTQKICDAGSKLSRARGMVKYHVGELQYCDIENEPDIHKAIDEWSDMETKAKKEFDKLIAEIIQLAMENAECQGS